MPHDLVGLDGLCLGNQSMALGGDLQRHTWDIFLTLIDGAYGKSFWFTFCNVNALFSI